MIYLISCLIAYLSGSILFGVIVAKILKLDNLRKKGSGNIGATNIARVSGKKAVGILVAILDGLKGFIPILFVKTLGLDNSQLAIVGMMALIGHIFPIWHHFKGGKGIAVFIGINLALNWHIGLIMSLIWISTFYITKISSISSLVMVVSCMVAYLLHLDQFWQIIVCGVIITIKHRDNIKRLVAGKEDKINSIDLR